MIIPHYNDENGLEQLLKSIPKREDLQVIIVDDKSNTQNFINIANNSGLPIIKTVINERTKSAGTCRNIGLENADGDYLLFADADDFFTKDAFFFIDKEIEKHHDSEIIFFNVTSKAQSGEIGKRHIKNSDLVKNYINKKGQFYEEKLRYTHNVPWGKLIKKKLVTHNNILFDQTIIANDGVFSLQCGKLAEKISASKNIIYCVTENPKSLTQKKDVSKFRVRLEVYVRYYFMLTKEERKSIGASPLPLIYLSKDYGLFEFFRTLGYFYKNKVSIFKYFRLNRSKIYFLSK